jgi:hypothetical protein
MYITYKLNGAPTAQFAFQRPERRLLSALAVDRPPDGLLGANEGLAGQGTGQFGLGDGVASSKHPVEGRDFGLASRGASVRHLVVMVVLLVLLLLLLVVVLELEMEMEMEMVFGGDEDGAVDFIRPSVDFDVQKVHHKM